MVKIHGWDIAPNHSGFVELIDGELNKYWFVTDKANAAKKNKNGYRLVVPKIKNRNIKTLIKLSFYKNFIKNVILKEKPDYVGIEDYAMNVTYMNYFTGEISGLVKFLCWENNIKFRMHDPLSIKMFTTHDGSCGKDLIEEVVKSRWDIDFTHCNPVSKNGKTNNKVISEDLCDAFSIAKLVWHEYLLRNGKILMSDLHPKEIRVFNRITKSHPVNLLARDWICKENFINDKG